MKINRRKFFKVCMGAMAAMAVPFAPTLPANAQPEPEESIEKQVSTNDNRPDIAIKSYETGEMVECRDLKKENYIAKLWSNAINKQFKKMFHASDKAKT